MHSLLPKTQTAVPPRTFIAELAPLMGQRVKIKGWVHRLREHAKTTFVVVKDLSGTLQCVVATRENRENFRLRLEDCVEVIGNLNPDARVANGMELFVESIRILARAKEALPFTSGSSIEKVTQEVLIENRPLVLRHAEKGEIFRTQARIVELFREYLTKNRFTEIFTSKIVASGTEGGTNLFKLRYFEKTAYLAQSPQFYKEQCVGGLERVFETGHVYRAEPHATSRHLTEYYSLDVELGFIEGPEEIMELERELLNYMFEVLNREKAEVLQRFGVGPLPSMEKAPIWEFGECLERLKLAYGSEAIEGLSEDLNGEAEKRLCELAMREFACPAVYVVGFPLHARPFYTAARGTAGAAQSFDLLFRGLEITTGGQRLHERAQLEKALRGRGLEPSAFESHLKMFELGMPPHGGFAIGAERLTAQILGLANIREATLYPRDRNRLTP